LPSRTIAITGGLGNQLFQLSAALSSAGGSNVYLDIQLGSPNLNSNSEPEILTFVLPNNIFVLPKAKISKIAYLSWKLLLRFSSLGKDANILVKLLKQLLTPICSNVFKASYRRKENIYVAKGINDAPPETKEDLFLVGYFQSTSTTNRMDFGFLEKLRSPQNHELNEFVKIAKVKNINILHIRKGDYRNEPKFGVLNENYFKNCLTISELTSIDETWLFTDDSIAADNFINKYSLSNIKRLDKYSFSPSETLYLMRHGSNYIISNSSFSWWAARSSTTANPLVIAPRPWFRGIEVSSNLIPNNWVIVPAEFD
jgi:hypothetical protein